MLNTNDDFSRFSRYKYFRVTGLFVACGFLFVIGYALRACGSFGLYNDLIVYILSVCLIAVSPYVNRPTVSTKDDLWLTSSIYRPLLALANYHIFGRMLYYVPHLSLVQPSRVLSTFGFLSLIIETLNGLGASFTANPSGDFLTLGQGIMKASLVLQLLLVFCFLFLVIHAHWSFSKAGVQGSRGVRPLFIVLYATEALMLARTIFRAVEHFETELIDRGNINSLSDLPVVVRYEWLYFIFEATFMLLNMCMWNIWHPRRYLPADISICLAADGKTEVAAPSWQDSRSRAAKIFDPFDLRSLCGSRKHYRDVSDSGIPLKNV